MNASLGLVLFCALSAAAVFAGDDAAELVFKLAPGQSAKYLWNSTAGSEATGSERDQEVKIKSETATELRLSLKASPPTAAAALPLAIKIDAYSSTEKKSIGAETLEMHAGKGKLKFIENGKVVVDSDNDIGVEDVKAFQHIYKLIVDGEAHTTLDAAGKPTGEPEGDGATVEMIRSSGAEALVRILAGRSVKPGESWQDTQSIPTIATFKLVKPAVSRTKSTFTGWETRDGKRLARIQIVSAWDPADLQCENATGMLLQITRVQGGGTGSCLFDPASGLLAEGQIETTSKYHVEGKRKDGQSTAMDVAGSTRFSFKQLP